MLVMNILYSKNIQSNQSQNLLMYKVAAISEIKQFADTTCFILNNLIFGETGGIPNWCHIFNQKLIRVVIIKI